MRPSKGSVRQRSSSWATEPLRLHETRARLRRSDLPSAPGGIFAVGISLPSTLRGSSHQRQSPTLAGCTHLFHDRSCRSFHEIYCQGSSGLVRRSVSARPGAHAPLVKDRTAQARKMGVATP